MQRRREGLSQGSLADFLHDFKATVLGFHCEVNLSGGQPRLYRCLSCTRMRKWREIVNFCYQIQEQHLLYYKHFIKSDDSVSIDSR